MTDLWDALDETGPVENSSRTVAVKTPDAIVVEDLINHDKIRSETEQLRMSLACSASIVVAAYKVADYVPNMQNAKHREFWEIQVSLISFSANKSACQYFKLFI